MAYDKITKNNLWYNNLEKPTIAYNEIARNSLK
jgi:hypothetical protein